MNMLNDKISGGEKKKNPVYQALSVNDQLTKDCWRCLNWDERSRGQKNVNNEVDGYYPTKTTDINYFAI